MLKGCECYGNPESYNQWLLFYQWSRVVISGAKVKSDILTSLLASGAKSNPV